MKCKECNGTGRQPFELSHGGWGNHACYTCLGEGKLTRPFKVYVVYIDKNGKYEECSFHRTRESARREAYELRHYYNWKTKIAVRSIIDYEEK